MKTRNLSLKPFILHDQVKRPVDWRECFDNKHPLDVEIGFGSGEFLVDWAQKHPRRNFVGLEQHWQRLVKTLKKINHRDLDNIRLVLVDARIAFERLFQPKTIENIYCLFPCPWPKKRHVHHRLFSHKFFKLANSRLISNGKLKIVTDFLPYREWIAEQLTGTGFAYRAKKITAKYNTKFERKWLEGGQREFFELQLSKQKHISVPIKEDAKVKSYLAEHFDPKKFKIQDIKGSIAVVLKDFLYDTKKKKGMVHLVVAEENITQHIWISILKAKKRWCVCVAEGQRFVPTEGIAKGLKHIWEAAQKT